MSKQLLRPKWMLAHVVIVGIAVTFILLGFWQFDRHGERIETNQRYAARLAEPAVDLADLLNAAGNDLASVEFRRVSVRGDFAPGDEILIRSQIHLGAGGFHVVTPFVTGEGRAVLVNRGWVPMFMDRVPVEHAFPPLGEVTVEGWVQLSQDRPVLGPVDSVVGRVIVFSRVNIPRVQEQVEFDLEPVYVVMTGHEDGLPEGVRPPNFNDNGPHLAYAIQWFGFALVGLVGYFFLVRKQTRQPGAKATASPSTTS